jgi:ubiquinone/menaquinone biosynthesis C-methylase UbiE
MKPSISESNGLAVLEEADQRIYSVGISTGGTAEMRMALSSKTRRIIATTIDEGGAAFAREEIEKAGLSGQIQVKLEDVAKPLPYADGYFDFVYARLVLHYLPKESLEQALGELHRVLKTRGRLFVAVRSAECFEVKCSSALYDPDTGMTTYMSNGHSYSRYFHSKDSIQNFLKSFNFSVQHVKMYDEQLCIDFQRTQPSACKDALIEVLASKLH